MENFNINNCIPCPYHDGDILGHFVKLGKALIKRMLYRVSLLDFNNGSEADFLISSVSLNLCKHMVYNYQYKFFHLFLPFVFRR